jgi:hypothetical protein
VTALSSDAEEYGVLDAAAVAGDDGWVVESVAADLDGCSDDQVSNEAAEVARTGAQITLGFAHTLHRMTKIRQNCRQFFAVVVCVHCCEPVTEVWGLLLLKEG